ncbi:hypothetical protein AVEN_273318-1 [Araneus ventricosus]|uniref:BTB domain-containing protein n=1 Tax=Araneus ventricosus TaxID=182803 RepID=A0A4Y2STM7_ARAVE|nr:hypothetical protein AVEN_273318-1 [Araneus ventricosus]
MFKAMFSSDMMEKDRSTIDLPDLDGVTLRRLLFYICIDSLEDLSWKDVFDLFLAADEYGMEDFKTRCSVLSKASLGKLTFVIFFMLPTCMMMKLQRRQTFYFWRKVRVS